MLVHPSMNTFKKWFAAIIEIITISYEPAFQWIKGQNVWKKE